MGEINWKNDYTELTREELNSLYWDYIQSEFEYIPFDRLNLSSSRVKTLSGRELRQVDIENIFTNKLVFGNKNQLESLKAAEFFKICSLWFS